LLGATAIDALSSGFRTILIDDCCRGVDLQDIETTKESILSDHGVIVQSHEVRKLS
jgi:nicotinamidase-related amidase